MPSRRVVALILAFWVATSAYIAYRDLWPRLFASGPPPVAIDLADEAAQNVPVRWTITRNGEKLGKLVTQMRYVEADDTFAFTSEYTQLRLEVAGAEVQIPQFTTTVRVTRAGDLREQSAGGKLELTWQGLRVAAAELKLAGTVAGGQLTARCEGNYAFAGLAAKAIYHTLEPVPVPTGQPLNPMQPVNRLRGVKPGQRWVVNQSDPLGEAAAAVAGEVAGQFGVKPPEKKREPLIGEVLGSPRDLEWHEQLVPCWVIEYRRDAELVARTWVRQSDGKVLKQEAFQKGEHIAFERVE
jgi:hypothetical protein